ncbi:hypothetical protein J4E86_005090 [Alternaria arbusti]|uniref:uncharacterized protein n=1 Tax=Alternaria arbusti TaxID=232088 RepID=UPI00221FB891|nr:uncharacterized protein J4E86_005090 [Alternaria arbusti]KAI4957950.1 hypothetical protein J4E86_005090 [Alternaria arbusti]
MAIVFVHLLMTASRTYVQPLAWTAAMHFPVPDPKRSRIAEACSGSVAPDVPSLLTIAPELRNQIYEYLLVDPNPITIENAEDISNQIARIKRTRIRKTSNFSGSSAILRTCRQVYHEAVGILYSRNSFRFQYHLRFQDEAAVEIDSPLEVCTGWIDDVDSCLPRLRTITINMDVPMIPAESRDYGFDKDVRECSRQRINILPLLDVFWNSDTRNTSVIFESFENLVNDAPDDSDSESGETELDVASVTNVLSELGGKDSLDLKKTRRFLGSVYVDAAGSQGTIVYRSTSYEGYIQRQFKLSMETQRCEIVSLRNPLTLFDLSENITDAIIRLALGDQECTYNFHTGITHGHQPGMLKVNTQLRRLVGSWFLRKIRYTLILASDPTQTSEAMFERLDRRIAEIYQQDDIQFIESPRGCHPVSASVLHKNAPTIILQFHTKESPQLAAVHIDAWDLLRVTSVFMGTTTIIVRVCGSHNETRDYTTRLGDIRKNAYLLLKHLEPQTAADTRKLRVQVDLDSQCVPMRAAILKVDEDQQSSAAVIVKNLDSEDFTSLFDKRNYRWWKPLDYPRSDQSFLRARYWPEHDYDQDEWKNQTMYTVLWRLYRLCYSSVR